MNNLKLYYNDKYIGILDNDHEKIYVHHTEKGFKEITGHNNVDLSFEVAYYYNEVEIVGDLCEVIPTVKYDVIFEDEEEEEDNE